MGMSEDIVGALSGLVGCEIMKVDAVTELGQVWPVIIAINEKDQIFQLEIACDAEGNGPGHVMLGLLSGETYDDYTPIVNKDSWRLV